MPEVLALPPIAVNKDSLRRHEGTKPGRAGKQNGRRLETVPAAARSTARRSRRAQGDPAGAAPSIARSGGRARRAGLLLRVLRDAGAEGLSIAAIIDAGVGGKMTVTKLLKAARAAGDAERRGPQRGRGVRWFARPNCSATKPPAAPVQDSAALAPKGEPPGERALARSPQAPPSSGGAAWPWRQVQAALEAAAGAGMSKGAIATRTGLEGTALDDGITHCVRKGIAVERDRVFFARGHAARGEAAP